MPGKPKTFVELFKFYDEYVKLLYSSVQAGGQLPAETLFELNAALDHISRHWAYAEGEDDVVEKAYSHLKRSCLDIFKLKVREAHDQYQELRGVDTSVLDNGEFDRRLVALYAKIKAGATEARRGEGQTSGDDGNIRAFDLWEPVYQDCVELERSFYAHPKLEWARKRGSRLNWKTFGLSIFASFIAGLLTPAPWFHEQFSKLLAWVKGLVI